VPSNTAVPTIASAGASVTVAGYTPVPSRP
jgi:hypothetical protein